MPRLSERARRPAARLLLVAGAAALVAGVVALPEAFPVEAANDAVDAPAYAALGFVTVGRDPYVVAGVLAVVGALVLLTTNRRGRRRGGLITMALACVVVAVALTSMPYGWDPGHGIGRIALGVPGRGWIEGGLALMLVGTLLEALPRHRPHVVAQRG